MQIIPSINVQNFAEARSQIEKALTFLPKDNWLHIDVSDKTFTTNTSWNNAQELKQLIEEMDLADKVNFEIHLMVDDVENKLIPWLDAGAKRIIVQVEVLNDLEFLMESCLQHGAEAGLAIAPDTSPEDLKVYFNKINFYLILGVIPGRSGQDFQPQVLNKINLLRQQSPGAKIEIDGGINPLVAEGAQKAGANIAVSASYIFDSNDPASAYKELQKA